MIHMQKKKKDLKKKFFFGFQFFIILILKSLILIEFHWCARYYLGSSNFAANQTDKNPLTPGAHNSRNTNRTY